MLTLPEHQYSKLIKPLGSVNFNHMFADAVISGRVLGRVYVDNVQTPQTFYIVHPYGMSLLFGDSENLVFNEAFKTYVLNDGKIRPSAEWMQVYPEKWNTIIASLFGDTLIKSSMHDLSNKVPLLELNTRVNFRFNKAKFIRAQEVSIEDPKILLVKNPREVFLNMKGSVIPSRFWDSVEDFCHYGTGYSLYYDGKLASTAFSSFRSDRQLELGIETIPAYQGRGLAQRVCAALINNCIENNLEPVWACRLENSASYKLAIKLGFEVALLLPYYKLS